MDLSDEYIRKQVEQNNAVWERSGFYSLLTRLVDSRAFDIQGKSSLQAVWESDCIAALKYISLKNSGL